MKGKLSPLQQRFVEEYLVDLNATNAVKRAGYTTPSAGAYGSFLLKNRKVQEAIESGKKKLAYSTQVTAERVIREVARLAFSDMRRAMSWGPGGVVLKDSSEIDDEIAPAISEVSQTTTKDGGTLRIKLHNKTAALDQLCRHLGIYESEEVKRLKEELEHMKDDIVADAKQSLERKLIAFVAAGTVAEVHKGPDE